MDVYKILDEKIEEADLVLVGVGSAFQYDWELIDSDSAYSDCVEKFEELKENEQLLSFIQYYLMKQKPDSALKDCFERLFLKLEGKNYFIVTTTIDDTIYDSSLDSTRIVTPCGGFRKLQCVNGCENQLFDVDFAYNEDLVKEAYVAINIPQNYKTTKCPICGGNLTFNQIGCGKYVENNYLDQWQQYRTWLMGTMHRKVVILELGAGLEFASIIRSPFEKMVTYNEKATFFRVHPSMSQLFMDEEVKKRAYGINKNVKEFVLGWK